MTGSKSEDPTVSNALAARQDDDADQPPVATAPSGGWTATQADLAAVNAVDDAERDRAAPSARWRHWRGMAAVLRRALHSAREVVQAHLAHPSAEAGRPGAAPHPAGDRAGTDPASDLPALDPVQARARIDFILTRLPDRGDPTIPANVAAAGRLLSDTLPKVDFQAVDLLYECFPRGTRNSDSRVLMAIARNTTRAFGLPGRLPVTSNKAWTMLDPDVFLDELAAQLAAICAFIQGWQSSQHAFLILEFAEVELIEYLFENLHPRRHASLLVKVMGFKVLSARRVGLLRRIPARVRRFIQDPMGKSPLQAMAYVEDSIALLTRLTQPDNFAGVVVAAKLALAETEKLAAQLAASPAFAPALPAPPDPDSRPLHPVMRGLGHPPAVPAVATRPAPPPPPAAPRRRFTKKQKTEAVLRVLQGEERDWVALSIGIRPELLARWQDAFLHGGSKALAPPKPREAADPSIDDLKGKLHALIQTVEHLSSQIAQSSAALPPPVPPALPEPAARRSGSIAIALPGPVESPSPPAPKPALALPPPPGHPPAPPQRKRTRRKS